MHALLQAVRDYFAVLGRWFADGWNVFWFRPTDPTTLACVRICAGLVLLYIHATSAPFILDFVGPRGWVDSSAIRDVQDPNKILERIRDQLGKPWEDLTTEEQAAFDKQLRQPNTWWAPSIWNVIENPVAIVILHGVFLVAIVFFTVGYWSRTASIIVWFGHLNYMQRAFNIWFGMDSILLMITLYLMFGPTGATLSVDRLIARWKEHRRGLQRHDALISDRPAEPSWGANAVIRMIQVHMCIVYMAAGLAKLQGGSWWKGIAGYYTMMIPEFRVFDISVIASWPDWALYLIACTVSYGTLFFEISFCFLIWHRTLRPMLLLLAFLLHVGIALFMGLGGFASIMLTGCLAFVAPSSLRYVLEAIFKGPGGMRFVYDRHQPATLSAASLIKAADPWGQVTLIEVADTASGPAGSLVLPDGKALQGLAALRKLVTSLRVLWLAWPLAVWPFLHLPREELTPAGAAR